MYWKFPTNTSSELESLLVKADVTLAEIMEADDIINHCKAQSKALIDFLLKPDVLGELVALTVQVPPEELDERTRFKYPNIACELLTSDVLAINERLAGDRSLLERLYRFLEAEPPLNPLLASYFSRIMGTLITRKIEQNWLSYQFTCLQVLDFLKAKDAFLDLLLKHLGTSAIMDLMLKLMTQVENTEMKQNILNWLDSNQIMQSLVSLLNSSVEKERHYNVAQLLCDFIRIARDTQRNSAERIDPDPLLNTLESSETVSLLLRNMFEGDERSESALVGSIDVLLSLLDVNFQCNSNGRPPNMNETFEIDPQQQQQGAPIEHGQNSNIEPVIDAIHIELKSFNQLLTHPPKKSPIQTTVGLLEQPLGNTRLQTIKLFAALIATKNVKILNEIIALDTFTILLDLFFDYPWNNFLHTQVEICLECALQSYENVGGVEVNDIGANDEKNALCSYLLGSCRLIERVLKAWQENDLNEKEMKCARKGYMGHLINILNKFNDYCASTTLGKYVEDNLPELSKMLDEFKETTLKETNAIQDSLLGGAYPKASNDDNDDYGDIPFPPDQIYAGFQQQLANSIDANAFTNYNDDAFNDSDDPLQATAPFNLSDDDGTYLHQQQEIFKRVCAQSVSSLDNDMFMENSYRMVENAIGGGASTDSDDDSPSGGVPMDVDPWSSMAKTNLLAADDPWGAAGASVAKPPKSADLNMGDWADFSSVSFENSFSSERNVTNIIENDLKVESIEIEPKADVEHVEKVLDGLVNETIEGGTEGANIAQVGACGAEEVKEAGDVMPDAEKGDGTIKAEALEPSNVVNVTDGDNHLLEQKLSELPKDEAKV